MPPAKPVDPDDEVAVFEYQLALEDYEKSRPELERRYQERQEDFTLRQRAIAADQATLTRLEAAAPIFSERRAWVVMPIYPYGPQERLLAEYLPLKPPILPGWAVMINCWLGIQHRKPAGSPDQSVDQPDTEEQQHYQGALPLLGLSDNGSDILCQVVYGFRIAMIFALIVASIGFTIGTLVGGAMGYYGGWFDILVQRFIEIWGSLPFLFTIMIVASIIQPSVIVLALMMIVLRSWMGITYTIRGEFYREKAKDYVQAAISIGVSDWKVIVRHILPNSLVPVVTFAPFAIVAYIGSLVSLDYLGFGLKPGTPSWGYLLQQGKTYISHPPYWSMIAIPSVAFAATLFCVVMIGEAVREGFDPKVFARLR
jgi:ABC-type microcin C transport system permease subunit YejE